MRKHRAPSIVERRRALWWAFVLLNDLFIPALIVYLYRSRNRSPVLSTVGMALVTVALTVAVGQWLGCIAGVLSVSGMTRL